MALRFERPVAVCGPESSGVGMAETYLRRRGFAVESLTPTPGNIAEFVLKRDGLIVWVAAELSDAQRQDLRVALKLYGGPHDGEPNPFHAWRAAQVIVDFDCGRAWFYRWLRQLVAELSYPEHLTFMTWVELHGMLVLTNDSPVGSEQWQQYVMTKPARHAA